MKGTISVVVATRNRQTDIDVLLETIARERHPSLHEVVVVDDASDVPLHVAEYGFPVRLLRNESKRGAAVSRNIAADLAGGDVLAFLDDDARPLPHWFTVISRDLQTHRTAITGRVLPFDSGVVSRARQHRYEVRYAQHRSLEPVTFFAGGNSAILRRSFLAAGGFPDVVTASDNGLVERLAAVGEQVYFTPDLRVAHRNSKGARIALREAWRAGRLAEQSPAAHQLRRIVSAAGLQPWHDDVPAACLNVALQAANSVASTLPRTKTPT